MDPQDLELMIKVWTSGVNHPSSDTYWQINGQIKQHGNTKDMIFQIPHLIEYVSSIMTLQVDRC